MWYSWYGKDLLIETLDAQKAEDIHSIDLKGTGFPADHMIIASGRSARQVVGLTCPQIFS